MTPLPLVNDPDPANWARSLRASAAAKGYGNLDQEWLRNWFAQAIQAGVSLGHAAAQDQPWFSDQINLAEKHQTLHALIEQNHRLLNLLHTLLNRLPETK